MSNKSKEPLSKNKIFDEFQIYILPSAIGPKRFSILETQMAKNGANVLTKLTNQATHVIVEDKIHQDSKQCLVQIKKAGLDLECRNIKTKILSTSWVTMCLKGQQCLDTKQYELPVVDNKIEVSRDSSSEENLETNVQDETTAKSIQAYSETANCQSPPMKRMRTDTDEKYACSRASSVASVAPANKAITDELQKLSDAFRSSGDHWRAHGYEKAISSIKAYGKEITSYEEAVSLPGVGKKMATKVWEILESGSLRKVGEICGQERTQVVELFGRVWGVGPVTADAWYQQGLRTLGDLHLKATLSKQQLVGLKHFEDFQARMPREETAEIGDLVINVCRALDPAVPCVLCGSYRRGKETCGDIDVMVAKDNDRSQFLNQVVQQLKDIGLITDDLVSMESSGEQKKYMGVCKLPGDNRRHRRLDIFVSPQAEFATALLHYTGSALFNRSIRLLAISKGMSLSEHCLMAGIIKKGKEILDGGHIVPTPTEESIFEAMGLDYRPPQERDH